MSERFNFAPMPTVAAAAKAVATADRQPGDDGSLS